MSVSSLFDGYNAGYAQELYEQFARNPNSVSPQWQAIFSQELASLVAEGLIVPDAIPIQERDRKQQPDDRVLPLGGQSSAPDAGSGVPVSEETLLLPKIARATALVQAFRDHGHQLARIDPLGSEPPGHPQLDPTFFGTSIQDLEEIPSSLILQGGGDQSVAETLRRFRKIYCGSIGYQFEHLEDPEKVRWLWNQAESGAHSQPLSEDRSIQLLERLSQVAGLERFLNRSYLGQKRFSIEGTDLLVPMLDLALEAAARDGAQHVILGMSHRGRLNVLTHILGVGYQAVLREFEEAPPEGSLGLQLGTGDVKYHLGANSRYSLPDGNEVEVSLAPNPSHLEFVNPVVVGMTRAFQFSGPGKTDVADEAAVLPVLIHGDAAFAAEGVVAESLNLARLDGYSVGGSIHIIVNNQIGFTTDPGDGRSTRYASDLAKGYDIPILHVNADDPEACLSAVRLAMAYRAAFHDDVLIDLVGYRRHGHNEGDEPAYTQPLLYRKIAEHPSVHTLWADRLVTAGMITVGAAAAMDDKIQEELRLVQLTLQKTSEERPFRPPGPSEEESGDPVGTSVSFERLDNVNTRVLELPESFSIHPKLGRQLDSKRTGFGPESRLDWAHAESLAFGCILQDEVAIRLTGQDTERGTSSQRHIVLHDMVTGAQITPLESLGEARFEAHNSPLSETAALGFEYGYSVAADRDLVIWEAQFGDFVNVAQAVIDHFIVSGHQKWGQVSGLTLLLPHGYEGQGPEHSSARLERFLQLCAENNMRIAYPTTPAQYFHLLRRQALASRVRPLVIMTPKSLLRHPQATSVTSELVEGRFHPVLAEPAAPGGDDEVTRLVLTSGKIYYDLAFLDGRRELKHVAIGRVEQLYAFPKHEVAALVSRYPNLREVIWAQEEPLNMGALGYIGPRLRSVVPREISLRPVSRPERASPAEGRHKRHQASQMSIVREALGIA